MLDVTKEEEMDVERRRSPERKPFLKFGVSAILGLERSPEDEANPEGIRTPPEERKMMKSAAVMLSFDKDVFSDHSVASGVGSGVGTGAGIVGVEGNASAGVKNSHPYLHSYFHPLIHASATKPISYASKSPSSICICFHSCHISDF